jgi:CTP synthase
LSQLKFPTKNGTPEVDMSAWESMARSMNSYTSKVVVALVGKYTGNTDSYLSVLKALEHAACAVKRSLEIIYIDSSVLEDEKSEMWAQLKSADAILVPGGFGIRGAEGKILAAKYARENKVPYLGICLGMQLMVVEYARNILGREGAHSVEFDEHTKWPTVVFMPEIDKETMGGTMRLGSRPTTLNHPQNDISISRLLYGDVDSVMERHRHRYEVNPEVVEDLEKAGLNFVGRDDSNVRMEVTELSRNVHPFYVGCQYHPEFKSRPLKPSPPFLGLLLAGSGQLDSWLEGTTSSKKRKV